MLLSELPVEVLLDNLLPTMEISDILRLGSTSKVVQIAKILFTELC